jgi:hypothetical protein
MDELSARVHKIMSEICRSRSTVSKCDPERGLAEQSAAGSRDHLDRDDSLVR